MFSLWMFSGLLAIALLSPLLANEKPARRTYEGKMYFPIFSNYPRPPSAATSRRRPTGTTRSSAAQFAQPGNWALYTLIRYSPNSVNYFDYEPHPAPPSRANWLGTDARRPRPAGAPAVRLSPSACCSASR